MTSRMLFKSTAAARPVAASFMTGRQAVVQRTFTNSPASQAYKESSHANPDHDPEKHKQDLLSKQKSGKGHWKPELASDSEEAVKADRAGAGAAAEDVAKLQERTKGAAEETSKAGTSMRDGL
ncbi:hypothetical protein F5B20DRAFT_319562 [Whalleya microplaca]|nr:hypothetical protein F5B20DRAFT_319562 [Whalleya microplaca]